mmetsp:Transcript_5637/g.9741  ORF Transcript_5637/g.9741 Transcript_5637/m.9741 type:complete len:255 (+) Transcript_5637:240-1004(+)
MCVWVRSLVCYQKKCCCVQVIMRKSESPTSSCKRDSCYTILQSHMVQAKLELVQTNCEKLRIRSYWSTGTVTKLGMRSHWSTETVTKLRMRSNWSTGTRRVIKLLQHLVPGYLRMCDVLFMLSSSTMPLGWKLTIDMPPLPWSRVLYANTSRPNATATMALMMALCATTRTMDPSSLRISSQASRACCQISTMGLRPSSPRVKDRGSNVHASYSSGNCSLTCCLVSPSHSFKSISRSVFKVLNGTPPKLPDTAS